MGTLAASSYGSVFAMPVGPLGLVGRPWFSRGSGAAKVRSMEIVTYGRYKSVAKIPNLVDMQVRSYRDFLQPDTAATRRDDAGLEALLREVFPIYSYDKTLSLEYISYELGRPRYP